MNNGLPIAKQSKTAVGLTELYAMLHKYSHLNVDLNFHLF